MTFIPFAPWEPDKAELNGQTTGDLLNVIPGADSYLPFPDLEALSSALSAAPLGFIRARSLSGQVTIFAGTATRLWKLNNTTLVWDDVSKPATNYAANSGNRWCFEQFGDYVVAVDVNDNPQYFQLGVSTTFDDLPGSPPRAAFVKAWGDFLCLMQTSSNPNRAHWSALNDIFGWTPGTDNSDFQDFPEGGAVQGSSRATNPLIFMERAIYKATFVPGSPIIFTFVKIHDGRGAKSPYSVASSGEATFFADEGSFFQIGPDGALADIGFEKVSRTIFGQMSGPNIATILGAVDPSFSRVYWTMDLTGAGINGALLIYDWQLTRWTLVNQVNLGIFPAETAGYTLEGLDAISTNLDALPFSLDSKAWQGGAPILAAFDADFRLGFFSGPNKQATLTTQEQGDLSGGITLVSSMYPVVDSNNCTMAIGSRMKRGDAVVWTAEISPTPATGRVHKMSAARFQRARVTIPAAEVWSHAQGVDIAAKAAGRR